MLQNTPVHHIMYCCWGGGGGGGGVLNRVQNFIIHPHQADLQKIINNLKPNNVFLHTSWQEIEIFDRNHIQWKQQIQKEKERKN